MENSLNIRKFFETIAKIVGDREGVEITVKEIREREPEVEQQKGA